MTFNEQNVVRDAGGFSTYMEPIGEYGNGPFRLPITEKK